MAAHSMKRKVESLVVRNNMVKSQGAGRREGQPSLITWNPKKGKLLAR